MAWNQTQLNPLNHPDLFRVNPGSEHVPTLVPQQSLDLFDLVDKFAARRAAIADQERRQQLADIASEREARDQAFGQRRLAAADTKQAAQEKFQRAKGGQEALASARRDIGAGRHPGSMVLQDESGNPVNVGWEYGPGAGDAGPSQPSAPPAQQPAPPQGPAAPDIGQPMARAAQQTFSQPPLRMPELAGMALPALREPMQPPPGPQQPVPQAPQPQGQQDPRNTVFVDENDQGDVRALSGPGDETRTQLPIDAFPPGAREGDRFAAADVNLRGGKGNPFSGPVPPDSQQPAPAMPGQSAQAQPGPSPQASIMSMSPSRVRGSVWRTKGMPGGEVTIDPEEARMASRDEGSAKVPGIDDALANENIPDNQKRQLLAVRPLVMSGMDPKFALELVRSNEAQNLNDAKTGAQQGMQAERLDAQGKLAADRNQTTITIAEMKRKRGRSGPLVSGSAGQDGSAFQQLFATNPLKAERVATGVDMQVARTMRNVNFDKLTGQGINRLKLGLKMLDQGGTGEFEAMMNFFGYIRGGVPAKNESDLWDKMTRNPVTVLDNIGRQLGFGALGTLASSRDLTPDEKAKLRSQMTGLSPQRHNE